MFVFLKKCQYEWQIEREPFGCCIHPDGGGVFFCAGWHCRGASSLRRAAAAMFISKNTYDGINVMEERRAPVFGDVLLPCTNHRSMLALS